MRDQQGGNVRQLRRGSGGGGEVYVLVAEERDRVSGNLARIRDLCARLRQDRADERQQLVGLAQQLALDAEAIIERAPAVGGQ